MWAGISFKHQNCGVQIPTRALNNMETIMKNINGTEEFNQLSNNNAVYVQFSANWCGPCRMLTKTIEAIEDTQSDITFVKVDVDQNRDLAQQFGVRGIPRVVLLSNGDQVGEFTGLKTESELKEIFEKSFK